MVFPLGVSPDVWHVVGDHHTVKTASQVRKRMPLHSTSFGKAILSELPQERVDQVVDPYGLAGRTASTITDAETLHDELAAIRRCGYAVDDEKNIPGVRHIEMAISSPPPKTAFSQRSASRAPPNG